MILEGRDLCFAYRSSPVLNNVNVRVAPGVTAIIGPNAAGKSTLLKCLAGLLAPQGNVSLAEDDTARLSSLRQTEAVSYLPQNLSTQATLTVFEAVLLGRLHKLRWRVGSDDVSIVEQLLEEFGLNDLAVRNITELSGGQLQMVSIAQALARQPHVLLLDEPTSNLDLQHQFEICSIIAKLTAAPWHEHGHGVARPERCSSLRRRHLRVEGRRRSLFRPSRRRLDRGHDTRCLPGHSQCLGRSGRASPDYSDWLDEVKPADKKNLPVRPTKCELDVR